MGTTHAGLHIVVGAVTLEFMNI